LLALVVGVRAEPPVIPRPLYLAWLAAYGAWERDEDVLDRDADDDLEPPVPPGLRTLTAAQRALTDFLRLDGDLFAVAAQTSPPLATTADVAVDATVRRPEHDLARPRIDQPAVLVIGLVRQRGSDFLQVKPAQVKHPATINLLLPAATGLQDTPVPL
jgi:hypothetical protein